MITLPSDIDSGNLRPCITSKNHHKNFIKIFILVSNSIVATSCTHDLGLSLSVLMTPNTMCV